MNISQGAYHRLNALWFMLKMTYGLLFVIAGADKFTNLITNWPIYVSPFVVKTLHLSIAPFLLVVGIVEIVLGLAILTHWTRQGAYVATFWFFIVAANLLSIGFFVDIAVRDVVLAISALGLGWLTGIRKEIELTQ